MQLTCPNCAARYLVDPAAIGASGRTVQCFRCGHKWQEHAPTPAGSDAPPPPSPDSRPVPDFVIRPQSHVGHTGLPAIPADPGLPTWLKAVIGVLIALALVGGGSYLFRDQVIHPLTVDEASARIDRVVGADGKVEIVVSGEIINIGRSETAASRLHLIFMDADGKRLAERAINIATGRIPPNGRAKFEARIENAPQASVKVDLTAE